MSESLSVIPVFYSELMLAETGSFSPSAAKPRHVLTAWQRAQLPLTVRAVEPVSEVDLCLAHDPAFVRGVLAGALPNGFGTTALDVARWLPYTTGAMLGAARAALTGACACAPVSGFHHAQYDSAAGYCTFNGLIVVSRWLLAAGSVQRILILDCDMHYGDGTDGILKRLQLTRSITNGTFGRWFHEPRQAKAYLDRLRQTVARFGECDLALYQAGADVHKDDPLGGVLTTEQMIERDRIVFSAARSSGTPIAWNLAGGYQDPLERVIALHVNTMRECVTAFAATGSNTGRGETPS